MKGLILPVKEHDSNSPCLRCPVRNVCGLTGGVVGATDCLEYYTYVKAKRLESKVLNLYKNIHTISNILWQP
jgi:hypothetical protein